MVKEPRGIGPEHLGFGKRRRFDMLHRIDAGRTVAAALKSPPVLITAGALALLAAAAVVAAIVVGLPPRTDVGPAASDGDDLVRGWPLPPGDPLEPRLMWERESIGLYTDADAARIALRGAPDQAALAERNDAAIDELYRTVK
jgi:hypothetical protein